MCFYNSLYVSAVKVASRYGKAFDAIEAWKQIAAERESREAVTLDTAEIKLKEVYEYRLAEEMFVIPAFNEPHHLIVTNSDQLQVMDWGLIPYSASKDKKEFYINKNWHKNARAEEIFSKWPWKMLIRRQRCIMPSTGYFEYHYYNKASTQPFFIFLRNQRIFSFAGLWDEWKDPDTGQILHTFVQITTAANPLTRKIHNGGRNPFRMPLILHPEDEQRWLDPNLGDDEIRSLLKVYPEDNMTAYPVYKQFRLLMPYDKRVIRQEKDAEQGFLHFEE